LSHWGTEATRRITEKAVRISNWDTTGVFQLLFMSF